MNKKRNRHSAGFKSKVALEAIKGEKTAAELISTHRVTSGQISTWKKQLLQGAPQLFESQSQKVPDQEALTAPLYQEIGRLKMELDWLKKKASPFS
jgi:transposase-like protein